MSRQTVKVPGASRLRCVHRLQSEYASLHREPLPDLLARPNEENLLECFFILQGPSDSAFSGGVYFGLLQFPSEYPMAPPNISLSTPNGRFQVDTLICMSNTGFHKSEWSPAWSIRSILMGFVSFFLDSTPTTGSVETSVSTKRQLAATSHAFNAANAKFRNFFPEFVNVQRPIVARSMAEAPPSQTNTTLLNEEDTSRHTGQAPSTVSDVDHTTVQLNRRSGTVLPILARLALTMICFAVASRLYSQKAIIWGYAALLVDGANQAAPTT